MLSKFKHAFYSAVTGVDSNPTATDSEANPDEKTLSHKFPYSRPHFLQFTYEEEIHVSADKHIRPIIVPRDISRLPWNTGYAEAVNAGKSIRNEDQACLRRAVLQHPESRENTSLRGTALQTTSNPALSLPYVYFSVFDGHAGSGAAVAAANQLQYIIHEKLVDIIDHLLPPLDGYPVQHVDTNSRKAYSVWFPDKEVSKESLITGALESAFWEMDNLIAEDRKKFSIKGGCTVLVSLFILGKVYIANAGDSRAIMVKNQIAIPVSNDFTPETERSRVRKLAAIQPHLLGGEFTHLDYIRRPMLRDLGKRVLYRDAHMTGWAYKTVTQEDLKIPVVHGEGKRSRVLATIGVTRGFGDHDLKALNCNIPIKPFLLSQPEVQVIDVESEDFGDSDVLVMGTDGLWDVISNEKAATILQKSLEHFPACDIHRIKYRYTSAAQDLVMHARGKIVDRNWRTAENRAASTDDISVFVIPLSPYKDEHTVWKRDYEGIRAMYDTDKDTNAGFGKLSLKLSPVVTRESPLARHKTAVQRDIERKAEFWTAPVRSKIVNGCEEKPATTTVLPKQTKKQVSASLSNEADPSKPHTGKARRGIYIDTSAVDADTSVAVGADMSVAVAKQADETVAQISLGSTTNGDGTISKTFPVVSNVHTDKRGDSTIRECLTDTVRTVHESKNQSTVEGASCPTAIPEERGSVECTAQPTHIPDECVPVGSATQEVLHKNSGKAPSPVEIESSPLTSTYDLETGKPRPSHS